MNPTPVRFSFMVALALAFAVATSRAELVWEQSTIELHPAVGDKTAVGHFKYENKGQAPIRIKSAKSSCGCTVAQSSNGEVGPGQKGEITATFTIGERTGVQVKDIAVETDDPTRAMTHLTLKTVIPELLSINPAFVYWSTGEDPKPKIITVKASKDFPAKNISVTSSNPEITAKIDSPAAGQWKIEIAPKDTSKMISSALSIRPEGKDLPAKVFYASASVTASAPRPVPVNPALSPASNTSVPH